jgi:carbon-monoxide dehydrogenase medium subunit
MKLRLKSPPSLADLSGIAEIATGVRVAVTGGGNGVFSHAGLGAALSKSFTAQLAAVPVDAAEMNSKIHGSATYRANLVGVLTQRAVTKALG